MANVLFVDDERTVLKGLAYIFSKHCPECRIAGAVQSAGDALRVLRSEPVDIVITDVKMPDMDGIQLTREIRERHPGVEVVILSGYDEYEFVRQALKIGAYDYLLKPCRYQTVVELLRKLMERKEQKERERLRLERRSQLQAAMSGKRGTPDDLAACGFMQMAVVLPQGQREPMFEERLAREIADWTKGGTDCDLVPAEDRIVVLFREPLAPDWLNRQFYRLRQAALKNGCQLTVAIHGFGNGPHCLKLAYERCSELVAFMAFNELSIVMDEEQYRIHRQKRSGLELSRYFSGAKIGKYVLAGEAGQLQDYLDARFRQLAAEEGWLEPRRFKEALLKELVHLEQLLADHGMERPLDEADYLREVVELPTFRQAMRWLRDFSVSLLLNMEDESHTPRYILSAVRYIEAHYMEDLSLKTVADRVYLNPWYFSSQFKKHTDLSFSEYLNKIRVKMAKEFLRQEDLKVYQVAEMVGFQDAAYFSTVFKNLEQMSPKDYRKCCRVSPSL